MQNEQVPVAGVGLDMNSDGSAYCSFTAFGIMGIRILIPPDILKRFLHQWTTYQRTQANLAHTMKHDITAIQTQELRKR